MKKIILMITLVVTTMFAENISLDKDLSEVHLKNNSKNILKFPFVVQKASLATAFPDDYSVTSKNKAIIITATSIDQKSSNADLVVWSMEGEVYLLKLLTDGESQVFPMVSTKYIENSPKLAKFESGRIDSDVKKLIKEVMTKDNIPGYEKISVKKSFKTVDLNMQKDSIFNGGKYRVEKWYIKNITDTDTLLLGPTSFYTRGVLAIAFEKNTLHPGDIAKAWFIIDKNTIYQNRSKEK